MRLEPLTEHFGMRVLDVRLPTADETINRALRALLARELILVLPGQSLSDEEHKTVSRLFGELGRSYNNGTGFYYVTDVGFVDDPDEKEAIKASTGELVWHQDHTFLEWPNQVQSLYAIDASPQAAPTQFASHVHAYDTADPGLLARLAKAEAHHEMVRESATHPLIDVHTPSGRQMLYANPMHTKYVLGMADEASRALLAEVYSTIYQAGNVYTHLWHTGDLVVWDNIGLSHRRPPISVGVARTLRGTEVGDARSIACVAKFGRWFYSRAASERLKRSSATMRVLTD